MRVIAGSARGVPLAAPPGNRTRPITDRVKETLFGILGARIPDARVLDLYAGSGAIGIEALSRGAASAAFVEADGRAVATLRDNLRRTRLAADATVVAMEVEGFLAARLLVEGLRRAGADVIFSYGALEAARLLAK